MNHPVRERINLIDSKKIVLDFVKRHNIEFSNLERKCVYSSTEFSTPEFKALSKADFEKANNKDIQSFLFDYLQNRNEGISEEFLKELQELILVLKERDLRTLSSPSAFVYTL